MDGLLYAQVRCASCRVTFPVWSRATDALLAAWAIAVGEGANGEALLSSMPVVARGRAAFVAASSAEHVSAIPWIARLLHGGPWIPAPCARGRLIEASVAAAWLGAGSPLLEAAYATAPHDDIAAAQSAVRHRVTGRARATRRVSWKEGSPYAPDAPSGQIEIVVEHDGSAYAVQSLRGTVRVHEASWEGADMILTQAVAAKLGAIPAAPLRPGGGAVQITAGAEAAVFSSEHDVRRIAALVDLARIFEDAAKQVATGCDGPLRGLRPLVIT